ncbi:MAG: hypothetical protein RL226_103 [Bacteroidota bacterium]
MSVQSIELRIAPLREQLKNHALYQHLQSVDDVKLFTEYHVFAVWDFMSLLKALQRRLTCVDVPWLPVQNSKISRFINEIVHGEESDLDVNGEPASHFEMYLHAMQELGADTSVIDRFVALLRENVGVSDALERSQVEDGPKKFVSFTFDVIESQQPHRIASAFTFGREDVIPDMFLAILKNAGTELYKQFIYYLERHIELDGDEHGPLSLQLIDELCGNNEDYWREAEETAVKALETRIALWDSIVLAIRKEQLVG